MAGRKPPAQLSLEGYADFLRTTGVEGRHGY